MAKLYLIHCQCGKEHAIAGNQAGSKIGCDCGKSLAVPTLRKLRDLPEAGGGQATAGGQSASALTGGGNWTARHAATMAGALASVGLLAAGLYLWSREPGQGTVLFDKNGHLQRVELLLERGTPTDLWKQWAFGYETLPSRGFRVMNEQGKQMITDELEQRRLYRQVLLALAGGMAALAAVAWFAWPVRRSD